MKHILIVEDYPVVRMAMKPIVHSLYRNAQIHEAASFSSALFEIEQHEQDLIVLDVNIPGSKGFKMIEAIRAIQKNVPILIFSAIAERIYGTHYLRLGANGFISKSSDIAELRSAIVSVVETGRYVSTRIGTELLNQLDDYRYSPENPLLELSPREITIMDLLLDGLWTKEIAARLDIAESTISTFKARLFEKMGVSALVELHQKAEYYKQID